MKKKKFAIFGGIVIVMIAFVVLAINNKPEVEETIGGYKEGKRVQVEYVKQENIETKISSSGKLEAINTKTIYLDASNKVVQLHKKVGDTVEKGELIITLDEEAKILGESKLDALEIQLAAAKQGLAQIQGAASQGDILSAESSISTLKNTKEQTEKTINDAKVSLANLNKDLQDQEKDLATNKQLLEGGFISQKEVDQVEDAITTIKQNITQTESTIALSEESLKTIDLQIQSAQYNLDILLNKVTDSTKKQSITAKQSEIKQLENQIQSAQMDLEKTTKAVIAPISGVITELPLEEGMTVPGGTAIVTIVDPSALKVNCNISPYYAADLRIGLDAEIKYTGSKTVEVDGKVTKVSEVAQVEKTASGETTSIPVEVEVTDPGTIIRPGFSVDVKVVTDTRDNVCVVPILAILEEDDLSYVYVVREDGSLEKRQIDQGLSNGLYIEASNIEVDEMIVSTVEDFLEDGMKVSYEKIGEEQ